MEELRGRRFADMLGQIGQQDWEREIADAISNTPTPWYPRHPLISGGGAVGAPVYAALLCPSSQNRKPGGSARIPADGVEKMTGPHGNGFMRQVTETRLTLLAGRT